MTTTRTDDEREQLIGRFEVMVDQYVPHFIDRMNENVHGWDVPHHDFVRGMRASKLFAQLIDCCEFDEAALKALKSEGFV
jgi:hypothetical protein